METTQSYRLILEDGSPVDPPRFVTSRQAQRQVAIDRGEIPHDRIELDESTSS